MAKEWHHNDILVLKSTPKRKAFLLAAETVCVACLERTDVAIQFVEPRDGQLRSDGEDGARGEAEEATDTVPKLRKRQKLGSEDT